MDMVRFRGSIISLGKVYILWQECWSRINKICWPWTMDHILAKSRWLGKL